ncbi:MAG: hypothetical protein ACK5G7_05930 [Erysipelotrichaceae bacterium]
MKYANQTIKITPEFPIKQAGFIQQTEPISEIHDDLFARILAIENTILITCDLLALPLSIQTILAKKLSKYYQKNIIVIIGCTHTHFGADYTNQKYQNELLDKLFNAITTIHYQDLELTLDYHFEPYDKIGKSRISNHKAHPYLQILNIYHLDNKIASLIIHNVHPTIMSADNQFFSAEYPGYLISKLNQKEPKVFHMFFNGAAGDISTRFTRVAQNYQAVEELATILFNKLQMIKPAEEKHKITKLTLKSNTIKIIHDISPIDLSTIPKNLTSRELETISYGQKIRAQLLANKELLAQEMTISCLLIGNIKLIFAPNELFSSFLNYLNLNDTILICYANGYCPYVSDINENFITYERFTDTLSISTKKELIKTLSEFSNS